MHATFEPAVTSDTFASIAIASSACCENIINDKLNIINNDLIFDIFCKSIIGIF